VTSVDDPDTNREDAPELPSVELLEGIPPVVSTSADLDRAADALSRGTGPLAVDAERASGFKYGQRAYLVQFFRRGGGTWLVDPTAFDDLGHLAARLGDTTWILHAASQDLPCMRDVGLVPERIFDTELAARLLGRERVGLGPLVESELGMHLAKGHGAADWSRRPLPDDWLRYAALDVEVLVDLHDILSADLVASGKSAWAEEEFSAVLHQPPAAPRRDPWRRTSGMHKVRGRRPLAIVRSLWESRDELARRIDVSPGRVLSDTAIVAAATAQPRDRDALAALPEFRKGHGAKHLDRWWRAVAEALALPEDALPAPALASDGPPPPRVWRDRDPVAADRLTRVRAALGDIADAHSMPLENLVPPDAVRRWAWEPPEPVTVDSVCAALTRAGARAWQVDLCAAALVDAAPPPDEE
jgi:ribonuclease D